MENKKKGWLKWLIIGLAVALVAGGVVLAVTLLSPKDTGSNAGCDGRIYVNVDRESYFGTDMPRYANEDGTYSVQFAVDGEQVRLTVKDLETVRHVDSREIMGLSFDENGMVTGVVDIEEFTGGYAVRNVYAEKVNGNEILCNGAPDYAGYQKTITLSADTKVYQGCGAGILTGTPTTVEFDDELTAVMDESGNITHVFVLPYQEPGDVYWNITRMYDSTAAMTTREPDVTGYYVYEMALNGEIVTVKTRDMAIANAIDKVAAKSFGLRFDEEGYVSQVIEAKTEVHGSYFSSWYHVTEVNGDQISTLKIANGSDQGQSQTGVLSRNCQIVDISGSSGPIGTLVDNVRVGDQIHGLKDCRGQVCVIFILNRVMDSEMYWNVNRQYDSAAAQTKRTPDSEGWYHILLAVNGQQVTYKTKDVALVNTMDARADMHFGLKVEDDVITAVYTPSQVTGGSFFASWYDVTEFSDTSVTARRNISGSSYGKVVSSPIGPDCKIYNVSSVYDSHVGEETTLRLGDRIHGETNLNGELEYIYVVNRLADSPLYWNVNRMWDSKNSVSTRTPNADGMYEFLLAYGGRQETFYAKTKAIADKMDSYAAKHFGLEVHSGNVITKVYSADSVTGGSYFASWCDVTKVGEDGITALRTIESSNFGKSYTAKTSPNGCQIYNVSSGYTYFCGEPTSIQIGDRIHGQTDYNGDLVYIYVVDNRTVDGKMYWNVDRKWDSTNSVTTRTPNADGVYELLLACEGEQVVMKTTDKNVVQSIDSAADRIFGLVTEGDQITRYVSENAITGGTYFASWCDVTAIENGVVTAERTISGSNQGKVYTATMAPDCKVYNVSSNHESFMGEETQLLVTDRIQGQTNREGQLVAIFVVERYTYPTVEHECTHVNESVEWKSWNGKGGISESGYYVLTKDITLTAGRAIADNMEVTLCLNGHTISGNVALLTVRYGVTLTICDHEHADGTYDGTMTSGFTGTAGGVLYAYDGATVNVYGGNFIHTATCKMAGLMGIGNKGAGAFLNIYDGFFSSGSTTGDGGNFYIYDSATMNIYGGTIQNGTSATNGGNIMVGKDANLNVYGGTITGGTAKLGGGIYLGNGAKLLLDNVTLTGNKLSQGVGKDIYALTNTTVTLNGKVNVTDMFLNNGIMVLGTDGLDDSSEIGVHKVAAGAFLNTTDEKDAACFESLNSEYKIVYKNGQVLTDYKVKPHTHCVCNGDSVGKGDHTTCSDQAWTGWNDASSLPTATGYYYLTTDVDLSNMAEKVNLARGVQMHICLNGHTIKGQKASTIWWVREYLSISDCQDSGQVISQSTATGTMLHVFCNQSDNGPAGTFELYGGTLTSNVKTTGSAGILMVGNSGSKACYFNMYGGKITGGKAAKEAGAVHLNTTGSVMNMYGGEISGNSSDTNGGGVYAAKGTFYMHGGTIKDNTASNNGGNLYVYSTGKGCIYGGTISGGSAAHGGSVNAQGPITMSGGIITGGYTTGSSGEGGNVRIGGSGVFTLTGGTIQNGGVKDGVTVTYKGGNIQVFGTLNIEGGTVTGGKVKNSGGNISAWGGKINITSGTVQNGYAPNDGGNIMVDNGCSFTMTGGLVTGGTCGRNGGGICVSATGTATVTGGSVTGNKKSDGTDSDVYEA